MSVIVQLFRTANPKDCKNATFDALSFFFLDDLILANVDVVVVVVVVVGGVVGLVKIISHVFRSVQYEHLIRRIRTCNLTVISSPRKLSNRPFWSTTRNVKSVLLRAVIGR